MHVKSDAVVFLAQVYPQGLVRHLALLAEEIANVSDDGYDFFIASSEKELDVGAWKQVESVFPAPSVIKESTFKNVLLRVVALLDQYRTVILHAGGGWQQMREIIPLKRKYWNRLRIVVTTHSFRIDSWLRIPMSILQFLIYARYVDKVVFQCPYVTRRFFGAQYLIRRGGGVIIPLGCEDFGNVLNEMPESVRKSTAREIYERNDVKKFVYLAGFRPGKRHLWLVKAFEPVLKRHDNIALVLFGMASSKKTFDAVSEYIAMHGLTNMVFMPGQIPRTDVPWVLQHSHCSIISSQAETFGHTYIEPMMAGLPVLGTRIGVGEYAVRDYETGLGISLDEPSTVSRAAEFIINHAKDAALMGTTGQKLVKELFSHNRIALMHSRMYADMLDGINQNQ